MTAFMYSDVRGNETFVNFLIKFARNHSFNRHYGFKQNMECLCSYCNTGRNGPGVFQPRP
jgi:hypothetical protein